MTTLPLPSRSTPGVAYPNPFGKRLQLCRDPVEVAQRLASGLPLRDHGVRSLSARDWWHRATALSLGDLTLAAGMSSPFVMQVEERPGPTLFLAYGGSCRLQQDGHDVLVRAGAGLLLSSAPYRMEVVGEGASGVCLGLDFGRLHLRAEAMRGEPLPAPALAELLARPRLLPQDPAGCLGKQGALRALLALASELDGCQPGLVQMLQFDDQIERLLLAMVAPDLDDLDPAAGQPPLRGRDALDGLIDWIRAHLHEPINLTVLEQRSHYSRRALQYAFQQRFGCAPMQWVRRERLAMARRRLERPWPGDTVKRIAIACGYRSPGLFSSDFQQRFRVRPSQLLRRQADQFS